MVTDIYVARLVQELMSDTDNTSPLVPLPTRFGDVLRLLGPPPKEAPTAVDPLVKLDQPLGLLQAFVGGLCRPDGQLRQPVEVLLVLDPALNPPHDVIPITALLKTYRQLPDLYVRLPNPVGYELVPELFGSTDHLGPLLYCRKRHGLFVARSPNTAEPLTNVSIKDVPDGTDEGSDNIPVELLVWDGPPEKDSAASIYSGRDGTSPLGPVQSFEQLILDQGQVVARAVELCKSDSAAYHRLAGEHLCCTCSERERCYPGKDGYAFSADRLSVVHASENQLLPLPLGRVAACRSSLFARRTPRTYTRNRSGQSKKCV